MTNGKPTGTRDIARKKQTPIILRPFVVSPVYKSKRMAIAHQGRRPLPHESLLNDDDEEEEVVLPFIALKIQHYCWHSF